MQFFLRKHFSFSIRNLPFVIEENSFDPTTSDYKWEIANAK